MRRAPRAVRTAFFLLLAGLVVEIGYAVAGAPGGLAAALIDDGVYNAVLVGAALVCLIRAWRAREERTAWALIAFAVAAWSAADVYYTCVLSKREAPPFPSISDPGWLIFYPACWTAVGRRASAGGQSTAVLLRVITERHPDFREHFDRIAELAEQTALGLDMSGNERSTIRPGRHAARHRQG